MAVSNFRIVVYDQNGTYRLTRVALDANPANQLSIPADGLEVYRDGDGNCLECTFQAIWPSVMIEERDIVELDIYDGAWIRKYAGVAVKSGNSQVKYDHSAFKLTGLKKRLLEVQIGIDAVEEDAALQFLHAVQSAIDSGQLGGVTVTAADCPTSGILEAKQVTKGRLLGERLDYLAGRTNRVWGVDANRKVFFRDRNAGSLTLSETGQGVFPTFEDTDSEALVTVVPFIVGEYGDKTPIRHTVILPEAAQFGVAVKPDVALDTATNPFLTSPVPTLTHCSYTFNGTSTPLRGDLPVLVNNKLFATDPGVTNQVYLVIQNDAGRETFSVITPAQLNAKRFVMEGFADVPLVVSFRDKVSGVVTQMAQIEAAARTLISIPISATQQVELRADWSGVALPSGGGVIRGLLWEFHVDAVDATFITSLARFHAELPTRDPATITVLGQVLDPQGGLTLNRADGTVYSNPVESIGLHLKLAAGIGVNGSVATVIKAGQKLPAEERAARFLTQRAIQQAAATSVNARS